MRPLADTRSEAITPGELSKTGSLASLDDPTLLALMLSRGASCTDPYRAASDLFDRFGSLAAIASADLSELARVDGVGPVALTDLKLLRLLASVLPAVKRHVGR